MPPTATSRTARLHAAGQELAIDYRETTAEALADDGRAVRRRAGAGDRRARGRCRPVPAVGRPSRQAGRAGLPVDAQPHRQGLGAGHRRRGVRDALAAARHPRLAQVPQALRSWCAACATPASSRRRSSAWSTARSAAPGRSTSATSTSTTCCTAARALAEASTTSSLLKAAAWMAGWLACIVVMTVAGREATAPAQRLRGDGAALADRHLPALSADSPRRRIPAR